MTDTPECMSDPRCDFEPGRWLLVGPTWNELPERVHSNAWARLRHESGLIEECGSLPWGVALHRLMKRAPEARVRVVACIPPGSDDTGSEAGVLPGSIALKAATRVTWHHRSHPDAGGSADPLQGLRTLLGPEPESLNFVAANGSTMLPRPRGLAEQHTQRWQRLLAAWARRQLERLHETADSAEEAWADWLANHTASEPASLVTTLRGRESDGDFARNDARFVLRADGKSNVQTFHLIEPRNKLDRKVVVEVTVPGRRIRRASESDEPESLIAKSTMKDFGPAYCADIAISLTQWSGQVASVVLHDGAGPAIELRAEAALRPNKETDAIWKVWQLSSNEHPTLQTRISRWRERGIELVVTPESDGKA